MLKSSICLYHTKLKSNNQTISNLIPKIKTNDLIYFFSHTCRHISELFNLKNYEIDFTIVYDLMENLKGKKMSLSDNVHAYEVMLLEATESKVFPDGTLKEVISHIERTFFQNYKLYEYVCSEEQSLIVIPKEIEIECPKSVEENIPGPLDEAIPERMYNKYVLKMDDDGSK